MWHCATKLSSTLLLNHHCTAIAMKLGDLIKKYLHDIYCYLLFTMVAMVAIATHNFVHMVLQAKNEIMSYL